MAIQRFWACTVVAACIAVVVSGCSATSADPSAATSSARASATPGTSAGSGAAAASGASGTLIASGSYKLVLSGDAEGCGLYPADGSTVTVTGKTATAVNPGGISMAGPITYQGHDFTIAVAKGRLMAITLTGTIGSDGALAGMSNAGGVNPSGQTGWACTLPMDLIQIASPAGTDTSGWRCSVDLLQKAIELGEPANTGQKIAQGQAFCEGAWASAAVIYEQSEFTAVYEWTASTWKTVTREAPCAAKQVPAGLYLFACVSN